MASTETTKETIIPTARTAPWSPVKWWKWRSFSSEPPNIAGIARKNVNSAAEVREIPIISAPMIVAPERDVPGKRAAINWKIPMMIASL